MRKLRRFGLAAVFAAAVAAPSFGQTTSTSTGGNLGTSTSGTSAVTTGNTTSGNTGNTGTTGNSSNSAFGASLATQQAAPKLSPPSQTASASTNSAINSSNFLGGYYGNPNFQGKAYSTINTNPGGFGTALYPASGTSGTTGRGGNAAGTIGFSSSGGVSKPFSQSSTNGQIVPLPTQISYPAVVRFQAPVAPPTQVAADLRGMIDRSTMISNPRGVQVLTDTTPGVIVLRGTVQDEDEAKTVEGMVRLTPGVRGVRNELTFPTASR